MSGQVRIEATEGPSLIVTWGQDGDMWVNLGSAFETPARFCTRQGGGSTPATLQALRGLYRAIEEDARPIDKPEVTPDE